MLAGSLLYRIIYTFKQAAARAAAAVVNCIAATMMPTGTPGRMQGQVLAATATVDSEEEEEDAPCNGPRAQSSVTLAKRAGMYCSTQMHLR